MNCRRIEDLMCEYVDGTLLFEERREVEDHLTQCPQCAAQAAEAELAVKFMRRVPSVEAPVELVADIIHETIGERGSLPVAAGAGPGSFGLAGWVRVFHPFLQPRFAMSMAMAVLSFSMLTFYGNRAVEEIRSGAPSPANMVETLKDGAGQAWDRTVQFYETLRLFYELQTEAWQEESELTPLEQREQGGTDSPANPGREPGPKPPAGPERWP